MVRQSIVTLSDGAQVLVRLLGESEDRSKPLLIALHGAPGMSSHLEPENSFGFLASRFRVLVYDARGSGESDPKPPLTDERWIADLDEIRTWAGEETFLLAGGSYGGFVALGYTLAHPQRVTGLILRDTWAFGPRGAVRAASNVARSTQLTTDPAQQVRLWSGTLRDDADFEATVADSLPILAFKKPAGAVPAAGGGGAFEAAKMRFRYETHNAAFSYSMPRFDVRARLREIRAPTLVVVGRHDPITPVEDAEEIHAGIGGSVLAIFEYSGHSPPSEERELFQERVWEFMNKIN
ncbi:alpha/beta hydrolase fold protein [Cordyceps fumosorosea ARSEF 2679]|uniref:Alpha/beta hydrolase fold protein n=1 Tax=Cordyceps fumosorosea (strain ARSEF 2679) TaxID=1081104 RepID=A0A162MYB1_CORFA|nr:alpha/beta hydrolase fold protein [Cordyceps fumosorosea ARSEF 2679]OAA72589.1 alpha/beta hydrolase fold protein [Cordyceps fumosorosea ARSEF 2679]